MTYCVDVSNEYRKSKSKILGISLLFSIILTVVIIGDILLITLSKDNYLVSMILAIILTVVFSWFAIFFFTNVFSEVNAEYRYYRGYESGLKPTDEVEFLKQSEELCYINGLYVYPIYVRYKSNLNVQDKIIFSFNKNLGYEMGNKLTITTYQRVLVKAEKHS